MKLAILTSALAAAAAIAAAPVPASADVFSAGMSVVDGQVRGHLVLADHNRNYRDHRDRRDRRRHRGHHGRHGRYERCERWRLAHRKLHRRFHDVELHRTVRNRRGDRIFIAHARNHRGRPLLVRYNACLGRVTKVTRAGHRRHRHGRY